MFIRNKINIFIILIFILNTISAFADHSNQDYQVSGRITNMDGEALAGANVFFSRLEHGTSADSNGRYDISGLRAGRFQITLSYMGYKTHTQTIIISAEKENKYDFVLEESAFESTPVVVTGSPVAVDPFKSPQEIQALRGREKERIQATSLGETLEQVPGIQNISAGGVAGKPVLRGHTGERIRVLNDGIAMEYQQYGERHAPNIDPFNYERIEIVKGAASLLYGSDAIGGAINLIIHDHNIVSAKNDFTDAKLHLNYDFNNNAKMAGLKLNGSKGKFGFLSTFAIRDAANFTSPDIPVYSETGKNGDPKFAGEIPHTDFEQKTGSLCLGYLTGAGLINASYNHFLNSNNFLLPNGKPIGLRLENQIVSLRSLIPFKNFLFKPKFNYQRNQRQATKPGISRTFLPDSAVTDLLLQVYTGRFDLEHLNTAGFSGTVGLELKYYDHQNIGITPLQPTGYYSNAAFYFFEEYNWHKVIINGGLRYDYKQQEFQAAMGNPLLPKDDQRSYTSLSGALGLAYFLTDNLTATAGFGRGFRSPSFYNLYVYGHHGGVFAFQIGNPDLTNESSMDFNISLRYRYNSVEAIISAYYNIINNYIYIYSAPNHPNKPQDPAEQFIFAHAQDDARIAGLEFSTRLELLDWLLFDGNFAWINSTFLEGTHKGNALPMMPATKARGTLQFIIPEFKQIKKPVFRLSYKYAWDKDAAGIYEPFGHFDDGIGPEIPFGIASTPAYGLWEASLDFDIKLFSRDMHFDFSVRNILDTSYRDFLDTYKGYALGPGRSFILKSSIPLF